MFKLFGLLVCKPTVRGGCLVVFNHLRLRARDRLYSGGGKCDARGRACRKTSPGVLPWCLPHGELSGNR